MLQQEKQQNPLNTERVWKQEKRQKSIEYGKDLETGKTTRSLEYAKCLKTEETTKSLQYDKGGSLNVRPGLILFGLVCFGLAWPNWFPPSLHVLPAGGKSARFDERGEAQIFHREVLASPQPDASFDERAG